MNRETTDDVDDPLFASHRKFRALEQQLYGHVLAAIDFARLSTYEQLAYTLMRKHDVGDDLALDLSMQLVQRALERVATDTARYFDSGPPLGITHAEAAAVAYDDDCPFCRAEATLATPSDRRDADHEHEHDEPCSICDRLAEEWRVDHADVLMKAGLAPNGEPS